MRQRHLRRHEDGECHLLDELKQDERTYILVAHNGIARFVKSYFQDMGNEEFAAVGVKNGEVCRFVFDS